MTQNDTKESLVNYICIFAEPCTPQTAPEVFKEVKLKLRTRKSWSRLSTSSVPPRCKRTSNLVGVTRTDNFMKSLFLSSLCQFRPDRGWVEVEGSSYTVLEQQFSRNKSTKEHLCFLKALRASTADKVETRTHLGKPTHTCEEPSNQS